MHKPELPKEKRNVLYEWETDEMNYTILKHWSSTDLLERRSTICNY